MTIAVIETQLDLAHATEELAASSDIWAKTLAQTGPLPMRRKPAGFATLLDAIVGQQVSIASARAIWARVCEAGFDAQDRMRRATPRRWLRAVCHVRKFAMLWPWRPQMWIGPGTKPCLIMR